MEATSLRFSAAARTLAAVARRRGLVAPAFRSPPRIHGAERTVRRSPAGGVTVSVQLRGRPFVAVAADMVEGVVVANDLLGRDATSARTALWDALVADGSASVQAA